MPKKYLLTQHDYEMLCKLFPEETQNSPSWESLTEDQKEYLADEFRNAPPEIKIMAALYGLHFGTNEFDEEEMVH